MAFNTGNPVPSTAAKDLSDNAENFDGAVNLLSDTWIDRLGVTRDTVNGRIKKMGYTVPVAYASGIVFSAGDNVKTVEEAGVVYAPLASALPFTTSGTFVGGDDAKFFVIQGVTEFSQINDISQTFNVNTALLLTGNDIAFPTYKEIKTSGYGNLFDGGNGVFKFTGTIDLPAAGDIDIFSGDIYDAIGQQFRLEPINGRVTSASMGLIPDGVTDYFADGRMDKWLQYLSTTDVTGVFIAGDYNCGIDQFYSNVSVYQEPGAVFMGTIHIAINSNLATPTINRAQNVVWKGEAASYVRVGSWNCDDVEIERIAIYEDAAKAQGGLRGGGVHFFGGSKSMTVGSIYIENSERSAALAVDWEPSQTEPEDIHLGDVFIASSYVHGVSLVGKNITYGKMVIKEYGMGNVGDTNINFALSQNPGGLNNAMGFSLGSFGSCSGGSLTVEQNPLAPTGSASAVNLFTTGTFECGVVNVDGSLGIGFQNNFTDVTINKLSVKNSAAQGIFNKAKMTGSELTVDASANNGIRNEQGGLLAFNSITTKNNGEEGYDSGDGGLAVGRMLCEQNNTTTQGFGCKIGTTSFGRIDVLDLKQSVSGVGGGVDFNGNMQKFSIGTINNTNATSNVGTDYAAVSLSSTNGLTHTGGGLLSADDGANCSQPLRIIGPTDINLNGFIINDSFNGQIVAGTIALVDRVGFMNCKNYAGTNISVATVSQFNCEGMTT